jgi:hypothetical protein
MVRFRARKVPTFFFLLAAAFAQSGHPQQHWKEYIYPNDEFAITAPSDPNIHPDPEAPDVGIYTWHLTGDVVLSIHTGVRPNCTEILEKSKDQSRNDPSKAIPGSVKDLTLNDNPGGEYQFNVDAKRRGIERVYCTKVKAYSLTALYPRAEARPPAVSRMLNSFRLLNSKSN